MAFERLVDCENDDQLKDEASRLARGIGFDLWAFSALVPSGRSDETPLWSVGNFPPALEAARQDCLVRYVSSPLSQLARHGIPHGWLVHRPASPEAIVEPAMEAFRAEAGRHGLRGGLCVPAPAAPGFSTLMLATAQETTDATLQQARPAALLFSRYLHLACMPQIDRFSRERRPRLRAREVECLSWAAMGKTTWEISRLLAISTHTVEYHLRSACERLDAVSRQRAVAKAIELGLLPPGPPAQPSRRAQPARHAPPAAPKPPARAVVHTAVPRG